MIGGPTWRNLAAHPASVPGRLDRGTMDYVTSRIRSKGQGGWTPWSPYRRRSFLLHHRRSIPREKGASRPSRRAVGGPQVETVRGTQSASLVVLVCPHPNGRSSGRRGPRGGAPFSSLLLDDSSGPTTGRFRQGAEDCRGNGNGERFAPGRCVIAQVLLAHARRLFGTGSSGRPVHCRGELR
jgi:hypothetical protein